MLNFLICLIISILLSFGISVALVEKSKEWPIRKYRIILQLLLKKIYWKIPRVFYCVTCLSFWAALISDFIICIISLIYTGNIYFFWPFSGFITLGFSWIIIEFINSLDKDINIINMEKNDNE